jgi:hypothetical protein
VRSFARTWTVDLKARKIRINAISPGPIETPAMDNLGATPEKTREFKAGMAAAVPLGRLGQADEIAKVAVFLASDDSSYVTGIELFVDGGMAQIQWRGRGARAGIGSGAVAAARWNGALCSWFLSRARARKSKERIDGVIAIGSASRLDALLHACHPRLVNGYEKSF